MGFLKIMLRFNVYLGFTELRKAVILTVPVYYNERIQIKVSNRKRQIEQVPGTSSWLSSTVESWEPCLILPGSVCDRQHGVLPARGVRLSLDLQSFYWVLVSRHG